MNYANPDANLGPLEAFLDTRKVIDESGVGPKCKARNEGDVRIGYMTTIESLDTLFGTAEAKVTEVVYDPMLGKVTFLYSPR